MWPFFICWRLSLYYTAQQWYHFIQHSLFITINFDITCNKMWGSRSCIQYNTIQYNKTSIVCCISWQYKFVKSLLRVFPHNCRENKHFQLSLLGPFYFLLLTPHKEPEIRQALCAFFYALQVSNFPCFSVYVNPLNWLQP